MLLRVAAVCAALGLAVLALRWFARQPTPVARRALKRALLWGLIALLLVLAATGRLHWLYAGIGALIAATPRLIWYVPLLGGLLRRYRAQRAGRQSGSAAQTSTVEARFVRMSINHDSGDVAGVVLDGRFRGARLEELDRAQLLELLRECRTADEESARLVEAYFDRHHEGWREADTSTGDSTGNDAPDTSGMSIDEALEILGLDAGASEQDIIAAHRRLMQKIHPDRGGSVWLAARINQAKDRLLSAKR